MSDKIFSIHPSIVPFIPLYILAITFFILALLGIIFPTSFESVIPDSVGLISFTFWGPVFFTIMGLIILVAAITACLETKFTTYILTSEDFQVQAGFFSKTEIIIPLLKIQDVTLSYSVMQNMLNVGNIFIDTADEHTEGSLKLLNIDNPEKYKKQIIDTIEEVNKLESSSNNA